LPCVRAAAEAVVLRRIDGIEADADSLYTAVDHPARHVVVDENAVRAHHHPDPAFGCSKGDIVNVAPEQGLSARQNEHLRTQLRQGVDKIKALARRELALLCRTAFHVAVRAPEIASPGEIPGDQCGPIPVRAYASRCLHAPNIVTRALIEHHSSSPPPETARVHASGGYRSSVPPSYQANDAHEEEKREDAGPKHRYERGRPIERFHVEMIPRCQTSPIAALLIESVPEREGNGHERTLLESLAARTLENGDPLAVLVSGVKIKRVGAGLDVRAPASGVHHCTVCSQIGKPQIDRPSRIAEDEVGLLDTGRRFGRNLDGNGIGVRA